jgi:hypothetical protein
MHIIQRRLGALGILDQVIDEVLVGDDLIP